MRKCYNIEYEFEIEVVGFLHDDSTEHCCYSGEEIGDRYLCTYGWPVKDNGYGICSKTMKMVYPLMESIRSDGDLEDFGGDGKYSKNIVCSNGCVLFRLTAKSLKSNNLHKDDY